MIVLTGKNGGFCFGVNRAIENAKNLKGENDFVLGDLIHNDLYNKQLYAGGLKKVESLSDERLICGATLLIRAHGEPEKTFKKAEQLGLKVIDCTCPFVKDIQKIVKEHYDKGYKIVIIGNANHPEIIGINGWCNDSALITENADEISDISAEKVCIVVQTTYSEKKFEKIIKKIDAKNIKTVDIFKTICYTTTKRQKEAEIISQKSEAVIVLGGADSNNTQKLYDVCREYSPNVFRLTDASDFDYEQIKNYKKVGVVLGASTPIEQFQEVISNMEKVTEEIITNETVETAEEVKAEQKSEMEVAFDNIKPNKDFHVGQIVTAKISSANESGLTLSMKNTKKDFELPKDEMLNEYNKDDYKDKIGESIRVMVVAKNPIKFSEKAMDKVLKEEAEIEEIKNGKIFEAQIVATNKGGLVGKYGSYEVFVPSSQIRMGFVKDLEKYVGKNLRLKAEKVESRGRRRQIVGSQRVILEAEKNERDAIKAAKEAEFFDNVQIGDIVIGTPVRFTAFGAFVEVNGFDCLAHISDLSWTGCKDCAEVLELGKTYEFKVLKLDQETKRVSIGYKQLQPKPWDSVADKYKVGDAIKGKVVRIVSFGAFVEVEKGIDGLVHLSQISNEWLENPLTTLEVGQEVDVKILDIKPENEKMTLSIKALLPEVEKPEVAEEEKPAKGKKKAAKKVENEDGEEELHEWKDSETASVSIADLIGSDK